MHTKNTFPSHSPPASTTAHTHTHTFVPDLQGVLNVGSKDGAHEQHLTLC
jgi:hypothetical protein